MTMATSTLNPDAPMFVPSAYRMVEDFSDQWWDLVRSSPWFRDYWLRECFSDPQTDSSFTDILESLLPDIDTISEVTDKEEENNNNHKDLVSLGVLKWKKMRLAGEMPRYADKAPKFVKVKTSPKLIQQPR